MAESKRLRSGMRRLGILAAAALLAGCGGGGAPAATNKTPAPRAATPAATNAPAPAASKKLVKATLRLPFLVEGYDAPLVLAKARGYYARQGLDVTVGEGKGSVTTAETVANGTDTFGFVDAGVVPGLIAKGAPIKVVAALVQKTPMGFIHDPAVKISAQSLRKYNLMGVAGSSDVDLLPAVLAKLGLKRSDVKLNTVSPQSETEAQAQHHDWIGLTYANAGYVNVLELWPQAAFTSYAHFGVNLYSFSLITSKSEIASHPGVVRRFVTASIQGWQAAAKDPKAAVQATVEAFPKANAGAIASGLAQTLKLLHTPATRGKPLGWSAKSDWQETLDLLHRYAGLKTVAKASSYYTDSFLPSS